MTSTSILQRTRFFANALALSQQLPILFNSWSQNRFQLSARLDWHDKKVSTIFGLFAVQSTRTFHKCEHKDSERESYRRIIIEDGPAEDPFGETFM